MEHIGANKNEKSFKWSNIGSIPWKGKVLEIDDETWKRGRRGAELLWYILFHQHKACLTGRWGQKMMVRWNPESWHLKQVSSPQLLPAQAPERETGALTGCPQSPCYQMQVHVPDAQWGQTNQNVGVWGRERFIAGRSKENGWLMPKKLQTPQKVSGKHF